MSRSLRGLFNFIDLIYNKFDIDIELDQFFFSV